MYAVLLNSIVVMNLNFVEEFHSNLIILVLNAASHGLIEFMLLAPSFALYRWATFYAYFFPYAALSCLLHGGC